MRVQFATLSMDLAYNQEKSVTISRFPTDYEVKELKKSKYKLLEDEILTSDNQLELKMYHNPRRKHVKVFSGGNYDFKEGGQYGVDIDIRVKEAEKELIDYLSTIMRVLCKKYFKKAIIFPSRHSVACQIDECKLTHNNVNLFLEDFVLRLENKMGDFKITKKEKKIEEDAEERVKKYEEIWSDEKPLPELEKADKTIDSKPEFKKKDEEWDIGFIFVTIVIWIFFLGTISAIFYPDVLSFNFFLWYFFASPITIIASLIAFVWWICKAICKIFDV